MALNPLQDSKLLEILPSPLVVISHSAVGYTGPFLWTANVLAEPWVTKAVTSAKKQRAF